MKTSKTTGTDSGIMNLRAVTTDGKILKATENVEGVCIILLAAVPSEDGECSTGQFVKCQVAINLINMSPVTKCSTGCIVSDLAAEKDKGTAFHETAKGLIGDVRAKVYGKDHSLQEALVPTSQKTKEVVEVYSGELAIKVATMALVHPNDVQCQVIKDVGKTVGSEASCTTNELMVVVSVHGSDKNDGKKTVAHDSGGGIPDALTSETGDGAPEAKLINGDIPSGGEDPDSWTADHSVDEPKKEQGADSCKDKSVSQCSCEEVEKVKKESLLMVQHEANSLPTSTNVLGLSYSNTKSLCVKSEVSADDSTVCITGLREQVSKDVGSKKSDTDEATSAGGTSCTFKAQQVAQDPPGCELYKGANFDEAAVSGVVAQVGASQGDAKDASSSDAILSISGTEISGGAPILSTECNIITLIKCLQIPLIVDDNQLVAMTWAPQGECLTVQDNKTSGQPDSAGTFLVLCGALQTEAMPDTDVNGTAQAYVKDKVINKEYLTCTQVNGGSLDSDTECTAKEVEVNKVVDEKKKQSAEVKNQGEVTSYLIEKVSVEYGDKAGVVEKIVTEIGTIESKIVSEGEDAEVTQVKIQVSTQVLTKSGEVTHVVQQGLVEGGDVKVDDGAADVEPEEADDNKLVVQVSYVCVVEYLLQDCLVVVIPRSFVYECSVSGPESLYPLCRKCYPCGFPGCQMSITCDHHETSGAIWITDEVGSKLVPCKSVTEYYFDCNGGRENVVGWPKETNEVHLASLDFQKCVVHDCPGYVGANGLQGGLGGPGGQGPDVSDTPNDAPGDAPGETPGGGCCQLNVFQCGQDSCHDSETISEQVHVGVEAETIAFVVTIREAREGLGVKLGISFLARGIRGGVGCA